MGQNEQQLEEANENLPHAETEQLDSDDSSRNGDEAERVGRKNVFYGKQIEESRGLLRGVFDHPSNKYGVKGSSCTTDNEFPDDTDELYPPFPEMSSLLGSDFVSLAAQTVGTPLLLRMAVVALKHPVDRPKTSNLMTAFCRAYPG